MTFIPEHIYKTIESSIPIACVDIVLWNGDSGPEQVGLILRDSPFGRVWCHVGGRINYGESVAEAVDRHVSESLGIGVAQVVPDMQPDYVYQWFPPAIRPIDSPGLHGEDPRKHSIALSFAVRAQSEPRAQPESEDIDFGWFRVDHLPEPMWPGSEQMITRVWVGLAKTLAEGHTAQY